MTYDHPVDVLVASLGRAGVHLAPEAIAELRRVADERVALALLGEETKAEPEPYVAPTPAPNNRQARRARAAEERKTR